MKKILLYAETYDSFWAHYSLVNDNYFYEEFYKNGCQLLRSNECTPEEADYIIFLEAKTIVNNFFLFSSLSLKHKIKYLIKLLVRKAKQQQIRNIIFDNGKNKYFEKSYLLILEGILDAPENHSIGLTNYVKKIFTWNDNLVDNYKFIKIFWPQQVNWVDTEPVTFSKRKLIVNISANKFSSNKLELYSERRSLINYLEKHHPDKFDLYGFGWNQPRNIFQKKFPNFIKLYNTYKGIAGEKSEIFIKYKFAIIYDNAIVSGWITEKFFDCLRSKCVPVYLGAPNITDIIPHNLFIDKRNYKNNQELIEFLLSMNEIEHNSYLLRINNFLLSEKFKNHLSTSLAKRIISNL